MSLPWFPMFPKDYLGDTMGLSCCEHGCYLLLLMHSWKSGPMRDDLDYLQRVAGGPPIEVLRLVLEQYWELGPNGWTNGKLEEIRQTQQIRHERRVSAGKLGGKAKAINQITNPSNAKAMPQQCSSNALATQNPEPRTHKTQKELVIVPTGHSQNSGRVSASKVPFEKIVGLWREILPELTQPVKLSPARKAQIRARWNDELPDLHAWRECFEYIRKSDFLMGKTTSNGRRVFRATLDWVTKQDNLLKIYEGRYHAKT